MSIMINNYHLFYFLKLHIITDYYIKFNIVQSYLHLKLPILILIILNYF